jgi:2-hydroxy-3-oxopropionate reductase
MEKKVGFIGLGIMGIPMVRNLMKAGFDVTVYNRTVSKADKMVAEGARKADSPADVARNNTIIITMVSDTPDVEKVILGENGIIEGIQTDAVVIDMSTISPQATKKIAARLEGKKAHMLDAPVSGGEGGAIAGTLSIMVGGDAAILERCRPVLEAMGKTITYIGGHGMGQTTKLMNQILVAGNLNAVCEALVFAQKQGVDLQKTIEAVKGGAAGSWQLSNLGPKIIKRDFAPGFMVELLQKDLRLVNEAAEATKTPLEGTTMIHQLFSSLESAGDGKCGTQALAKVVERLANTEVKQKSE